MLKKIKGNVLNNPLYKFRRFWVDLNDQEKVDIWNLLTVLRGEDGGSMYLKQETTGRIRQEIFGDDKILERQVIFTDGQIEADEIKILRKKFLDLKTDAHWRQHFISALTSISKYVFKSRLEDLYKLIGLDRS